MDFATLALNADTRGLEKGELALDRMTVAAGKTEAAAEKMTAGTKRLSKSADTAAKSAKVTAQQAGLMTRAFANTNGIRMASLQLSQVAQQGAVTGNYMQALSIQLPDLLLGFGTLGAVAGVAAGALGPLVLGFIETSNGAGKLTDKISEVEEAIEAYKSAAELATMSTAELEDRFGSAGRSMRGVLDVLNEIKGREAQRAIDDMSLSLQELLAVAGDGERRSAIADFFDVNIFLAFGREAKAAREIARQLTADFVNAQSALDYADTIENSNEKLTAQIAASETLLETTIDLANQKDGISAAEDEIITGIAESLRQMRLLQGATKDTETAMVMATSETNAWENAMRGVRVEVSAILGSLSSIGGGMISNAAKQAEIDALRAGGTIREATVAARRFEKELEFSAKEGAATNVFQRLAVDAERYQFEQGLALDEALNTQRELARERGKEINRTAKAAKSASTSTVAALQREIAQREALLGVTGDARKQMEAVYEVQRRLGKDASKYSEQQISAWANQLVSIEDAEAAMNGLNGTAGELSGILSDAILDTDGIGDAFEGLWQRIQRTVLEQKIIVPLVGAFTGTAGTSAAAGGLNVAGVAQQALGFTGGGTGLLGGGTGLLGSLGSGLLGGSPVLGSGLLGGAGSTIAATFGAGGGAGGLLSVGANAAAVGGGLAATVGAALPVLGIALAAGSFLKKAFGREYAGSGLTGAITARGIDAQIYDRYAGGLFRSDSIEYRSIDRGLQGAIDEAVFGRVQGIRDNADTLNLSTRGLRRFRGPEFRFWTEDMTEDQIMQRLQKETEKATERMARLVLGTKQFSMEGESAIDALSRLSSHLTGVNDLFETIGKTLFNQNLKGAAMASDLVKQFGGLEELNSAVGSYYSTFFSEEERRAQTIRLMTSQFRDLGVAMPRSQEAFRNLVEGLNLSSERGRALYANLVQMSDAFAFAFPDRSAELAAAQAEEERRMQDIADLWGRISEGLRGFLEDMLNSNLTTASASQVLAANRMRFNTAFQLAESGDTDAAQQIVGYARSYLDSLKATATSDIAYRRAAARILGQVSGLADLADIASVPQFAYGGYHNGGIRIVGEHGPELEATGPARYLSHAQTKAMMGGSSSQAMERKMDALVSETKAMRAENRQLKLKMLQYQRKDSRILQSWDVNGQPAERTE